MYLISWHYSDVICQNRTEGKKIIIKAQRNRKTEKEGSVSFQSLSNFNSLLNKVTLDFVLNVVSLKANPLY
jgi:hypothetical protein